MDKATVKMILEGAIVVKNIVRLTAGVGKVNVANPKDCSDEIIRLLKENSHKDSDIIVFPRLSLCSPSSGSLLGNSILVELSEKALDDIREYSHKLDSYIIVGFATEDLNRTVSSIAVIHKGSVVSYMPTEEDKFPNFAANGLSDRFDNISNVIECGKSRIAIYSGKISEMAKGAVNAVDDHCDIMIVPAYEPMVAGKMDKLTNLAKDLSQSLGIAIVLVNGGIGDTSSPYVFTGFTGIYECGKELTFTEDYSKSILRTVDLDLDIIRGCKKIESSKNPSAPIYRKETNKKSGLLRDIPKNPFLPIDPWEKEAYIEELFEYQVKSLVSRMSNTGIKNLVLGISGGIDSTSALFVSVAACDYLGLPRTNIHGIVLPGLGTSGRTYNSALSLLEQLRVSRQDISIKAAVQQHFDDIGHSGEPDTTYENAQARERTQVLLDIANMVGGLVVGTGDLSEEALGFATYGGDHLSSYNVNPCMTKTMLREQLKYLITSGKYPECHKTIQTVLDTPVSPELLPTSEEGEIVQKTEDILGPYELHEFFLYYFVVYGMKPSKIHKYACAAFGSKLSAYFIKEKLALFLRKFCFNQFKRSCTPDAASITEVNLLGVNYTIASDLDPSALLKDLDNIE